MTDAIVDFRKKQIDDIVDSVRKDSFISITSSGWRLVIMATGINQDAIMGLMSPQEGITEEERLDLQDYNRKAHDRLRV